MTRFKFGTKKTRAVRRDRGLGHRDQPAEARNRCCVAHRRTDHRIFPQNLDYSDPRKTLQVHAPGVTLSYSRGTFEPVAIEDADLFAPDGDASGRFRPTESDGC